jgi:hypothetical protein
MSDFFSMPAQILFCSYGQSVAHKNYSNNPNPLGTIHNGSATDDVMRYLQSQIGFRTEAQIMWHTRRSHSAISWAILALFRAKRIRRMPDSCRNSRYFRYCWRME